MKEKKEIVKAQKVNYTKADVLSYLNKVRNKVINFIKEDYQNRYNAALDSLIADDQELQDLFDTAKELSEKFKIVASRVEVIVAAEWPYYLSYNRPCFDLYKKLDLPAELRNKCYDISGVLKTIKEEKDSKVEEVEKQYKAVEFNLKTLTTPLKMRNYLDSLNFDTSYLDQVTVARCQVEPEKLIPCKSQGLLEG